ncbi:hypothetical protein [Agromyces bauzanensis]|uniref:Uncharacterized protein n=1 Tax=Agromyces bauzanensis TaxID=1308924 RepID=A0A917PH07_9MICO|nr:hypothetical protein [Agromyces bauzanensis]GGJ77731.1 hypothetical protein GCM10011372_14980 [Agromyces bauzanensis]
MPASATQSHVATVGARMSPEYPATIVAEAMPTRSPARGIRHRHRHLHATDAGWTIGHGPALVGTAHELIRFLAGIGTEAPRPARDGEIGEE